MYSSSFCVPFFLILIAVRLGSDPNKIFSYETMQDHLRKFGKYGLLIASSILPVMATDIDGGLDMDALSTDYANGDQMNADTYMTESSKLKFYERMRDVVIDMNRLQYI